ncbi:hypothetical protein [Zobellia uliginosa]|uniref:hypothetical protein n=1 Tax=Zobellia uliginosa TaxID=143224 RepID=UPI001C06F79A|nr:hypothetical protein [Zobellia uliginosa]MBU2945203.1 hypothetical protein [Zobellia uliginosa]
MKTAVIEISTSHEECLYSQALFMENTEIELDVFIHPKLNAQILPYKELFNTIFFVKERKGLFKNIRGSIQLLKSLKAYDLLIFNTASSSKVIRNTVFFLNLYPKIKCIGLLHNTKKLNKSFTQKIISTKIKKYFVLADHLIQSYPKNIKLNSFYPIFFPVSNIVIRKDKNDIWIVIPGRIDLSRRNYSILLNALEKAENLLNIKFIFLGKLLNITEEGSALLSQFKSSKFSSQIVTFDRFIENEEYHAYLSKADMVMPLLKHDNSYLTNKISGSFNLAYAHKKPLLSQDFFNEIDDLAGQTVFYNEENLHSILEKINQRKLKYPAFKNLDKWSFQNQKTSYLNFIDLPQQ